MVTRFFLIGIFLLSSFSFLFGQEYELVFDLTQNGSTLAYDTPYGQLGINDHLIIQTQSHGIIRSDGTSDGTRPICTELNPAHIHSMGVGQTKVYIFTQDFYEGRQLWVYDVISDSLTFVKDLGDEVIDHIYMAGDKAILFGWLDQDEANVWQSDGTADGTSILGQVPYEGDNISFSCNNDIAIFYPKYTLGDVLIVEGENLNTLSTYVNNYSIANGSFISGYILDNWLLMTSNENEGILLDLDSGDTIVFITSCKVSHAALIGDKFCYSGHGPEGVIDLFLKESIQQQEPNEQIFNSGSFYNTGLAYKGRYFSVSQDIWANIVTFNNEFNLSIRVHGIGDHIALQNPQIIGFGDNVYFNEIDDYDTQFRLVKASMCPEIKSTVIDTLADIFSRYVAKPILCTIDDKMLVSKYEEDTGFELYRYYPAPDLDGDCYDETFDCDDSDPNLNPSAIDIPGNGIDEDCSGDDDVNDFTAFVSPNPISDLTTIQLFDTEVANLMIYSLDGRLINHYKLTSESTELSLNHLTSGFYIFKFIGPFDKTVTRKVIRM